MTERVDIETLDAFAARHEISTIDIVKMDVQGWEMEVLKGATSLFKRQRIQFVYSEVGFRRADRDTQHFAEINDFLESHGFWLCGFYDPFRWGKQREFLGFANALYARRDDTAKAADAAVGSSALSELPV